jgi:hypothetical protein
MIAWAELVSLSCLRIVDFVVCAPAVRIDDDNTIRFYVNGIVDELIANSNECWAASLSGRRRILPERKARR